MPRHQGVMTKSGLIFTLASAICHVLPIAASPPSPAPLRPRAPAPTPRAIARDNTVTRNAAEFTLSSDFVINCETTTRTFDWTVSTETGAPDGYSREMLVINGQFPGPLIEANEGDTIIVNVHNDMVNGTGIHWRTSTFSAGAADIDILPHPLTDYPDGMLQNGTDWADGVPGVTQCPIPAKSSFTYQFKVSDQYGTYWYHSHMGNTMADGLFGPLIVHSPLEPYVRGRDYDYDQIIFLGDWMHDTSNVIVTDLRSASGYRDTFASPTPDSLLVNAVGVYNCSQTNDTCTTQTIPDITVVPNKKYRFRIINHSSHAIFKFSIDDHPLKVIAADGTPIVAVSDVHQLPIGEGERYDVIVDTSVGTNGSAYYIRAAICTATLQDVPSDYDIYGLAALRYVADGSNVTTTTPTSSDWSDSNNNETECTGWDDSNIVPYVSKDAPASVLDKTILTYSGGTINDSDSDTVFRFFVNSVTWLNYIYRPMLFTVHDGGPLNSSIITHHVFSELGGADIVVNNADISVDHSFHLHGSDFFLVARGNGTLTSSTYSNVNFTTSNPPRRDTLVIPRDSYAILRIITDNPGCWPLHCHVGWHLAEGKMAVIVVQPNAIENQIIPSAATGLCNASNLPSGDSYDTVAVGKKRASYGLHRRLTPSNILPVKKEVRAAKKGFKTSNKSILVKAT